MDENLWKFVAEQFPLGRRSLHGPGHWERVCRFGMRLAETVPADAEVVKLFALFHDSRRENDVIDPDHGARGAELALRLHGDRFELEPARLDLLVRACRDHTSMVSTDDPTLAVCWDSDRLDLWRVGIYPRGRFMCTEEARRAEVIDWAVGVSVGDI